MRGKGEKEGEEGRRRSEDMITREMGSRKGRGGVKKRGQTSKL